METPQIRGLTAFPFVNVLHIENTKIERKRIYDQPLSCHHTWLYYQQLILKADETPETLDYWTLIEARHTI
ncbi:MAG: hypothetical protein C0469_13105 [Cyanobacteria bacterium DS2.3.42]|nr:hypothetical protein [Cyanobacteria bacterium DS2.3.42]